MTHFDRVMEALREAEDTARFLDGRDFDVRPWQAARRSLSMIRRQLDVKSRELEAFRAVLAERPEAERG